MRSVVVRSIMALAFLGSSGAAAFAPASHIVPAAVAATRRRPSSSSSSSNVPLLNLAPDASDSAHALASASTTLSLFWKTVSPEVARGQFYFFFFAGTGAGGIGLGQVPKILSELGELRNLGKEGASLGGESLNAGPLATLFTGAISKADVEQVLAKMPSSEAIVARGVSKSYFASKGYVAKDDFMDALVVGQKCNPLASAAAFEAVSKAKGSCVSPIELEEKVAAYSGEGGLGAFSADLTGATSTRLGAYGALAFLLFIIFDLIIESGINAFGEGGGLF